MTTNDKSSAMRFLESVSGGPLTLGDLLLSIRLGEEVSQTDFATRLGISRSHLCDIEKGRKTLSLRRAAEFARTLGYSETQFARLALQGLVEEAGLELTVQVTPAVATAR
ncbi:MAG: helix-turn-helix transcriptional regulator [bacterium]|nr:helix-turn-helix transcriptional regulator [bacterium]